MEPAANIQTVFAEVLHQIFEKSRTSDLIDFRLVSRHWNKVARQILLKRGALKITFHFSHRRFPKNKGDPCFCSSPSSIEDLCDDHFRSKLDLEGDSLFDHRTLQSFLQLVTTSKRPPQVFTSSLPVSNFEFIFEGSELDRNRPDLSAFFQQYGPKIRALTLENCVDYFVGHPGMPNFLLQYTPNLETLIIREAKHPNNKVPPEFCSQMTTTWSGTKNELRFALPHLKLIKVDQLQTNYDCKPTCEILEHLIKIAPQLQKISLQNTIRLKLVNDVFLPDKLKFLDLDFLTLKKSSLFSEDQEELEKLVKKMLEKPPGSFSIKNLKISLTFWPLILEKWNRGSAALRQIFEANSNCLNRIILKNGAAAVLNKARNLPALSKVTSLKFFFTRGFIFESSTNNNPVYELISTFDDADSPGNSLTRLFPNLEKLEFTMYNVDGEEYIQKLFPYWNERLSSVKTLRTELENYGGRHGGHQFEGSKAFLKSIKICPEVETLEIFWPYSNFRFVANSFINLTQLTSLRLEFNLDQLRIDDDCLKLDAALTGLSREMVAIIYNNWEKSDHWETPKRSRVGQEEGEDDEWVVPRVNSSILNLQNLQNLHLEFKINFDRDPRRLISGVSAKFGFDCIENLKVLVVFDCSKWMPRCSECAQNKTKDDWLKLHRPLLAFSNVTLETK